MTEQQTFPQSSLDIQKEPSLNVSPESQERKQDPKISYSPRQENQFLSQQEQFANQFGDIPATQNETLINREQQGPKSLVETFSQRQQSPKKITKQQNLQGFQPQHKAEIIEQAITRDKSYKRQAKDRVKKAKVLQRQVLFDRKTMNLEQIELKIKLIAKTIREKVRKDQKFPLLSNRRQESKLKKNQQKKPDNEFQDNAFLTLPKDFVSPSKIIKNNRRMIKQILQGCIFDRVDRLIDIQQKIRRTKLKLDPIRHKYPMTNFRRSIIAQSKLQQEQSVKTQREREEKLLKRKRIFNNSRYERYEQLIKKQNSKYNLVKGQPFSEQSIQNLQVQNPQKNESVIPKEETLFIREMAEEQTASPQNLVQAKMEQEQQEQQYDSDF